VLLSAALAGCGNSQPYISAVRLERGLVIVLPGIEGRGPLNEAICRGLGEGGVNLAIELRDWTAPLAGPLYNLRAQDRNRRKALEIANRIRDYQSMYPDRPVVLVGHSGGGAMAIWIAENLPHGHTIDGIITISPAISPIYFLQRSLTKCTRGLVNFYSPGDWIMLGVGTTVYGTMDGEHSSSAGRVGFKVPSAGGAPRCYEKLFQIAHSERMSESGYFGGHFSSAAAEFVAVYVAPFVRSGAWNDRLVARVVNREWIDGDQQPLPRPEPTSAPAGSSSRAPLR